VPIFGRWCKNRSVYIERLKTNDMRTYRKRRYFRHAWKKIWLRYVDFCQFYTPLNMEENKVHFRHLIFFYRKGKNVTQAINKICAIYSEDVIAERTVRKWFARFKAGDFNLEDQERGRPSTIDEDQIKTLIENNPRCTIRKLAEMCQNPWAFCEAWLHKLFWCMDSPRFNGEKSDRLHFHLRLTL